MIDTSPLNRRKFAQVTGCAFAGGLFNATSVGQPVRARSLAGAIGITTGGLNHQRENKILNVMNLPEFVRDELGMQLIDLNTRWLESFDREMMERVRRNAEKAGCFFTNLKVNHDFGNLYAREAPDREKAMANACQLVEAAKTLGARWIRFNFPKFAAVEKPESLEAHRAVARFAESKGVQLVVENGGWMKSDPESIVRLVRAIGRNAAPGPDTGNWNDDARYEGLRKSFPGAVTCDFKVYDLDAQNRHTRYDIKRCFDVGWKAGFRGPWAIEHWNTDNKAFARETRFLRDQLVEWMKESRASSPDR